MELNKALEQISSIHDHLNRTEIYKGFRAVHVAAAGLFGCLGAFFQPRFLGQRPVPLSFVYYWVIIAALNLSFIVGFSLYRYFLHEKSMERKKTRYVWTQFTPSLVIGLLLTLSIAPMGDKMIALMPGLWAFVMSLGVFSTGPFLPRMSRWIALYYLLAGFILLGLARKDLSFSPWCMGLTFGFGQILGAVVLYINIERKDYV